MVLPLNIPTDSKFSDSELVALCMANKDLNIERNENGQLLLNNSPTYALTSSYYSDLNFQIYLWNKTSKLGRVFDSNSAFFLPDGSMRGPDVAWISNERWDLLNIEEKKSIPKLVPDFIIELESETDNLDEIKAKMVKWISNGVKLAWLVSPKLKQTFVYNQNSITIISFTDIINGENVLKGLQLRLDEILS